MAFPSWDTATGLATDAWGQIKKKGLAGLAAERLGKTAALAGDVGEAYMENVAEPTARAANLLIGGEQSTPEDRRLQREAVQVAAARKKIAATEPTSAAAAQPPPKPVGSAVGPETLMTENAGEEHAKAAEKPSDYYDRVKAVKMPNGKIVFTNVAPELVKKGGTYQDYGAAVEQVTGRPFRGGTNVVEGPAGRAYVQPGQEMRTAAMMAKHAPTPDLEDVLPPLTDVRDIAERQDYMKRRGAEQMGAAAAGLELQKSAAETAAAVAATQLDPMKKLQLETEAKYGPEMVKTEAEAARTRLAITMLNRIQQEMNRVRALPPSPERDRQLADLEESRKLYLVAIHPQAAAGLMRPDPYAMFGPPAGAPAPGATPPAAK